MKNNYIVKVVEHGMIGYVDSFFANSSTSNFTVTDSLLLAKRFEEKHATAVCKFISVYNADCSVIPFK